MDVESAAKELNIPRHTLQFTEKLTVKESGEPARVADLILNTLKKRFTDMPVELPSDNEVIVDHGRVSIKVVPTAKSENTKEVSVTWSIDVSSTV